ncbi:pyridoxal phosphate-dependent transferase [Plectosphaerella plurivora]|uniref:Pyridoxal phosphate-dependent transferase n=1 Tax=Plectosphaerella plurivora TaxID=936078 RepID=A0A9P8V0N9_9PEZI|nr:pyridoxal phosphate-dependent transferase [Plectosphaerella plurivora]
MSLKITTPFGEAVPPAPRHAVTVHMGGWDIIEKYGADSSSVIPLFKNAYPRMKCHRDILQLSGAVLAYTQVDGADCLLFSSLQSARECVEFSTSSKRDNGQDMQPVPPELMSIRSFVVKDLFHAVIFPSEYKLVVSKFWSTPGAGISSRFAETNLERAQHLREVSTSESERLDSSRAAFDGSVHQEIRERIRSYLMRAPKDPQQTAFPATSDIYLYQTGMASIYKPHRYMLELSPGVTVLFGMAFMNTLNIFQDYGPGFEFFGNGSDNDLDRLEQFLRESRARGRRVQAIWAEFPSNPLLVTPDIMRLRQLATEYNVVLGIDDTIGSWANIDITGMADILVTSVTKSFNGYADVIAGCAILNPASLKYDLLKPLFKKCYIPELYVADAQAIEKNSRDYLQRSTQLNANAAAIVHYLQSCADDPKCSVRKVHYPSVNASRKHYEAVMRPATAEFSPGYGCLLSVELADIPTTHVFYENLNVHKSVHLGAPFTLAFAYTMCPYAKNLSWTAGYGMLPTQIRISAGLEDTETLLEDFRIAVEAADRKM